MVTWLNYWRSRSINHPPHHGVIRVQRPAIPESLVGTRDSFPPSWSSHPDPGLQQYFHDPLPEKHTYPLLGLWGPHKEALILDLISFKVGKNSLLISFIGEREIEVTGDVSITLMGGGGARQHIPFKDMDIF